MPMRETVEISILDFPGVFLGPALGLVELGHRVRYFISGNPFHTEAAGMGHEKVLIIDRAFGRGEPAPVWDADLVVYVESFSDAAWAMSIGCQLQAPYRPDDPLADSINPLQLELRLVSLAPRLMQLKNLVVVDMSDLHAPEHAAFASLPGIKLRREKKKQSADRSRPFPFLYHPTLLALEYAADRDGWFLPRHKRTRAFDLYFAGSVDHPRYEGTRRESIDRIGRSWPGLRVGIDTGVPYNEVLARLQCSTAGIYLPGRGELCFRAHELLALGVPGFCLEPFGIYTAPGVERALSTRFPPATTHEEVLEVYRESYSPRRSAEALLAEIYSAVPMR
jgi:hypothetical protein